ncbi:MAG: hypothetical protein IPJ51_08865 [Saprospiraceae bacterium]|nr:hypothetical protein [Saprospiraceae bacterium]
MYKECYMFDTPDSNTTIWRYIDFPKFVDLITSNKLFFCRSDNFEDPYEGIFQLRDHEETKVMLQNQKLTKKFYFLNCWHINEHQSDAMWKIFLNTKNGIAIKSKVGNVIESFKNSQDDIYIGKVNYRDFEKVSFTDLIFESQNLIKNGHRSINQFNYKRISFEHEKELRLFYIDTPIPHVTKNETPRDPLTEKYISVDIKKLINEIVIAPFADIWFQKMVKRLLQNLGLHFEIIQSNLYMLKE